MMKRKNGGSFPESPRKKSLPLHHHRLPWHLFSLHRPISLRNLRNLRFQVSNLKRLKRLKRLKSLKQKRLPMQDLPLKLSCLMYQSKAQNQLLRPLLLKRQVAFNH